MDECIIEILYSEIVVISIFRDRITIVIAILYG